MIALGNLSFDYIFQVHGEEIDVNFALFFV